MLRRLRQILDHLYVGMKVQEGASDNIETSPSQKQRVGEDQHGHFGPDPTNWNAREGAVVAQGRVMELIKRIEGDMRVPFAKQADGERLQFIC